MRAINVNFDAQNNKLDELNEQILKEERKIIKKINLDKKRKAIRKAIVDMKQVLNILGRFFLKKTFERALIKMKEEKRLLTKTAIECSSEDQNDDSQKENQKEAEDLPNGGGSHDETEENLNIDTFVENIKAFRGLWFLKVENIPTFALICSLVLILGFAFVLYFKFNNFYAWASGLLSLIVPYVTGASSVMTEIRPRITELEKFTTKNPNEQLKDEQFEDELVGDELIGDGLLDSSELSKLREKKAAIKSRTLFLKGHSLRETITSRIDTSNYESNLGIVHKVRQDLDLISESMLNPHQKYLFPRGKPRIILFVDDLDRCDDKAVVAVIEALQLLVKTNLFVAALAIDPRYVTLSLEKHYKGILDPFSPPTGMDFLEKIIQIPFSLPGIQHDTVNDFIDKEIDVEEFSQVSSNSSPVVGGWVLRHVMSRHLVSRRLMS